MNQATGLNVSRALLFRAEKYKCARGYGDIRYRAARHGLLMLRGGENKFVRAARGEAISPAEIDRWSSYQQRIPRESIQSPEPNHRSRYPYRRH